MTELEKLKNEKKEIEKRIKELTGSTGGNYFKSGNVRFGMMHLRNHGYEPFSLSVLCTGRAGKERWITIFQGKDLIASKNVAKSIISGLQAVLLEIENNADRWL